MRRQLAKTWYAFLAHHPQPRPIQRRAVKALLSGESLLLASATASGKTEAYAAPLTERWLSDLRQGLQRVVVVAPTRALVNDLYRRLEPPLAKLSIKIARRTGDHPKNLEQQSAGWVITTPESLDSVLSRHPRWLAETRAVVLDELHVLEGTPRGEQVRVLLARLQRVVAALNGPKLQRVGATATVDHAQETAARFLGAEARVEREGDGRDFEMELLCCSSPVEFGDLVFPYCRRHRHRKVLVFMPSRAEAEQFALELRGRPPFVNRVAVHHASLSRSERERVEKAFLRSSTALCFATNTLELGVDIGDVDLVVMYGVPPDVGALLQRVGRGGRRSGQSRALGVYRYAAERVRFEHLHDRAQKGVLLGEVRPVFRSVWVQQSFSLCFQNRSRFVTAQALAQRIPASELSAVEAQELLENLVERGWFEARQERYGPTEKLEREFEHARIHHNFAVPSGRGVDVVDESGRVVGQVQRDHQGNLPSQVTLGGRSRQVTFDHGRQARVKSGAGEASGAALGGGTARSVERRLALDFGVFLGVKPHQIAVLELRDRFLFGHFLGTQWARLLGQLLRARYPKMRLRLNEFVGQADRRIDFSVTASALHEVLGKAPVRLADRCGLGPWSRELPREWLVGELKSHLGWEALLKWSTEIEVVAAGGLCAKTISELAEQAFSEPG